MRSFITSIVCLLIATASVAQTGYYTISGVVLNAETKVPLQGASVYAENTTLGAATDQDGKFYLSLPDGGYNLVVSYTGFNTQDIKVSASNASSPLSFQLTVKEKVMQEVAIVSTNEVKNGWEKYGKFFLDEFIGQSPNGAATSIKNPEVLKFYYSKRKNRLKVLAGEPLIIENNALGYTIKYELDSLVHEYNSTMTVYTGYPLFEEMKSADSVQQHSWQEARRKAYYGSVLHFMRSLYNHQIVNAGYEIQFIIKVNGEDSALKLKDFYKALNYEKSDSLSLVSIKPNQLVLGVLYKKEKPAAAYLKDNPDSPTEFQFSTITFKPEEKLTIEKNGFYFDQNDIVIAEYWEWSKMADMLPFDFWPE